MAGKPVNIDALLALNPEYQKALWAGEPWAWEHMRMCESINAGEPEGFRRKFDGKPRKWCGAACPHEEGCVMCTLPENSEMAHLNRQPRDPLALAREGVITVSGQIDHGLVSRIKEMLSIATRLGYAEIEVRIESNGGNAIAALAIFDLIRNAPVQKRIGRVEQYARSGGAIILQACERREASPDARLLIHGIRFGEVTLETLRDPVKTGFMAAGAISYEDRIEEIFMRRTNRTLAEIRNAYRSDTDMTSEQALRFGLIDAVREKNR